MSFEKFTKNYGAIQEYYLPLYLLYYLFLNILNILLFLININNNFAKFKKLI